MNTKSKFLRNTGILVILALIGLGVYRLMCQWIPAGSVGLIYNASGGLEDKVYPPQRLYVGWTQKLYTYPTKLQAAIYSQDPVYGEEKAADGISIGTNDNAQTLYDVIVYYRIKKENVMTVFKEFGAIDIEQVQSVHIRRFVKEAVNAICGHDYGVWELMGSKRAEACAKIKLRLIDDLGKRGITIEEVMLTNPQAIGDTQNKITQRVNAHTALVISDLKSKMAEIDSQIAVTQGQTEAKARSIISNKSNAKSLEMQNLELMEAAIDAWDGRPTRYQLGNGKTTIVIGNGGAGATGDDK